MQTSDSTGLTTLLAEARADEPGSRERLIRTVFPALRQIAAALMAGERDWHTLQPTALVHEVFMRLFLERDIAWQSREHFFYTVSREMRQILVAHARSRLSLRRGGRMERLQVEDFEGATTSDARLIQTIAVGEVLDELERQDARAARVVELRFFAGLTQDETAAALGVSAATIRDDWRFARMWLKARLEER